MKSRRMILSIFWIVLGTALFGSSMAGLIGDYWSGMGGGFIGVGIAQLVRNIRYLCNDSYREKVDTANADERNRYLSMKAWSWAGYLFVMAAAVATVVFQLLGRQELSMAAAFGVALIVLFYWVSYLLLQKKY